MLPPALASTVSPPQKMDYQVPRKTLQSSVSDRNLFADSIGFFWSNIDRFQLEKNASPYLR